MAGAEAFTGFGVEIFVEQHEVLPRGVVIVALGDAPAEAGPVAVRVLLKNGDQAFANEIRDLVQSALTAACLSAPVSRMFSGKRSKKR